MTSTSDTILVGKSDCTESRLALRMANRHGIIAGATGTGKTATLKVIAEGFSDAGVPVFIADVKGDLAGFGFKGTENPKFTERLTKLKLGGFEFESFPIIFWDVFGKAGHHVRTTISEMGPLLISRLLGLNEVQTGVMNLVFKIADDQKLMLLDLKDLRSTVQFVGDNAKDFTTEFGNITTASIGAIQRGLLQLEEGGGDSLFGEPALSIWDLIRCDSGGRGQINVLAADQLMNKPAVYSTFMLWLLSELFETLPEVGDLEKPKLVFFFDEAHLLFDDAPKALIDKIEQVVRLIRSKGVGVYFVTQNPMDIPDKVAAQLGNRVQHALRAFTPKEQKTVVAASRSFRENPAFDTAETLLNLGTGEALVSLLRENGEPSVVERCLIAPPRSRFGAISDQERATATQSSPLFGKYEETVDRESAFEILKKRAAEAAEDGESEDTGKIRGGKSVGVGAAAIGMLTAAFTSAARSIGTQVAREIMRGVLGSKRPR
jgi:DNA helicase HerA-like ATPase